MKVKEERTLLNLEPALEEKTSRKRVDSTMKNVLEFAFNVKYLLKTFDISVVLVLKQNMLSFVR